jgi:hypothetical protein
LIAGQDHMMNTRGQINARLGETSKSSYCADSKETL